MTDGPSASASTPWRRVRAWLSSNTIMQPWQPSALRRPTFGYVAAAVVIALSAGLTYLSEHYLPPFTFHGMLAFLAILGIAVLWGLAPALLSAGLNALLLNFVVTRPNLDVAPVSLSAVAADSLMFLLTLCFGLVTAVVGYLLEARRRELLEERAERMRAHAEARAERDHFQQIIELLPEALILYNDAAERVSLNRAAATLLGPDLLSHAIDPTYQALRHLNGKLYAYDEVPIIRSLRRGEVMVGEQLLLRSTPEGADIPILLSSAPLHAADGTTRGGMVVFQDISTMKKLEQQRDRVLAIVAHDLRNPLTSISGMAQLLQLHAERLEEPVRERFAHSLKTIETAARGMATQIGDLLDFAQAQTGRKVDLALEPTDVIALLRGVLAQHQLSTDEHTLELRTAEDSIVALVDARRLERAVANLVVNAIKYSPEGGPVVVAVAQGGEWLNIQVSDRGLGIPSADLPRIFEQYFRAGNVAATIPGTGIGLAGVRHMIERHGGTVAIESTEGEGTTVTIRLPLPEDAGKPRGEER